MADGDSVKVEHTVLLQSDGVSKTRMTFGSAATVAKIKTFLAAYSGAAVIGVNKNDKLACAPVAAIAEALVDDKLIVTYKDSVTLEIGRFVIPAYGLGSVTLVFDDSKEGKRLSKTSGDAAVLAWKTANTMANDLIFLSGTPIRTP